MALMVDDRPYIKHPTAKRFAGKSRKRKAPRGSGCASRAAKADRRLEGAHPGQDQEPGRGAAEHGRQSRGPLRRRAAAGGEVLSATLRKSSGNPAYNAAVERAIMAAQPLPVPTETDLFQENFRELTLVMRPKDAGFLSAAESTTPNQRAFACHLRICVAVVVWQRLKSPRTKSRRLPTILSQGWQAPLFPQGRLWNQRSDGTLSFPTFIDCSLSRIFEASFRSIQQVPSSSPRSWCG